VTMPTVRGTVAPNPGWRTGQGSPEVITLPGAAPGQGMAYSFAAGRLSMVQTVTARLTTTATAGSRHLYLGITDATGNLLGRFISTAVQAASKTTIYVWANVGATQSVATLGQLCFLPTLLLPENCRLTISGLLLQATDQLFAGVALVTYF
jgi:hypothetical protein